ncbi:hypothetical protein BKA65DRAFT_491869 [Rhexocercosporidium sp. MPI-PUGE-AT-0058]|nr:hypothetical protein BKA65DRAFT_491869 [Rhexocercosporidium sp. MPI-PUGE-AT-0058]
MATPVTPSLRYLIPVLSSTASVSFAFSEYWTFIPFLRDDISPQSLVKFCDSFLYQIIPGWLGFGMTSALAGYLSYRCSNGHSRRLYGWGVVFALAHYAFGYIEVSQVIEKIAHGLIEGVRDMQRYWLKIHTARTLCSDIPAMIYFIWAFLHLCMS